MPYVEVSLFLDLQKILREKWTPLAADFNPFFSLNHISMEVGLGNAQKRGAGKLGCVANANKRQY